MLKTLSTEIKKGLSLPIMEQFSTLQGEGYHSGKAAYFIRLAGCDVGCVWCDVKESWDANEHKIEHVEDIVVKAHNNSDSNICIITGGEPAMYNLTPLTAGLHKAQFDVHIETSGAYPLIGNFDWITVSPKKFKAPLQEVLDKAHELKIIVFNKSDFNWATKHAAMVNPACKLYLQPEWEVREKVLPLIIQFIKDNPIWQVSLQTHKYLGIG